MATTKTAHLYNALRAMGPVSETEIPSRLARQAMELGVHEGNEAGCRKALSLLSRVASRGTAAEFEAAVQRGEFNTMTLSHPELHMATGGGSQNLVGGGVDSCEGGCS